MTQKQYKFSLSIRDKHHRVVKKIVDGLLEKGNGALSQSIRDGLRLLNDLRRGNVTVLLDMFPDIVEKLCPQEPPKKDDSDLDKIADKVAARLEGKLQHSAVFEIPDSRNAGFPAMKQSGKGIGQGVTFSLPLVDDDDDENTIVLNKAVYNTGENALAAILKIAF